MKQYLLVIMMLLSMSTSGVNAQGRHRHHQPVTVAAAPVDSADQGVEAFSDTTSVAPVDSVFGAEDSTIDVSQDADNWDDDWESSENGMVSFVQDLIGGSVGGIVLALFAVALVFLFLLLPFIIIIMVLRYLIRRHNDRVTLAQHAMDTGQPVPEEWKPIDKQDNDYLWRRGIKNAAIGLGLMVMFGIWDADVLVGVGGLVLCIGIGQLIISKTSKKNNGEMN